MKEYAIVFVVLTASGMSHDTVAMYSSKEPENTPAFIVWMCAVANSQMRDIMAVDVSGYYGSDGKYIQWEIQEDREEFKDVSV